MFTIKRTPSLTGLFILLLFFSGTAFASGNNSHHNNSYHNQMHEIIVEIAFHHLGDGAGFTTYVVPDAEGLYWDTTVWLKRWQL